MPKILIKCLLLAWLLLQLSNAMAVTVSVRVEADNDDAEERISDGEMYQDSSDLELGFDDFVGGLQIVGMRFRSVAIPQGATINSAYLEFETDETDSDATSLMIFGENVDDANQFGTSDDDISDRPKTSASTNWSPSAWNSVNELHQTPDIATIIKEIVDRPGWSTGNDLVIIIEPGGSCTNSDCERTAESHDGTSSEAPLLVIDYSAGAPPAASACSATFTDGLTNSGNGGKIKFENSAQLLNNPDTILGTSQIDNNGNVSSCDSANCSAGGSNVPQLTSSYIEYTSGTNLRVNGSTQTISANDYKDVTVKSGGSLFMSSSFSTYHFKKLKVESNSLIYLTAGDYFLEEIEIKGNSQLIVQGAGTARIYVKDKAKFKESSVINGGQSGDPSKLVVYFFAEDDDQIKIEGAASFAGYIYSEGKVEIKDNNSKVLGAISSVGELKLKDASSVTFDDSIDDTDFGDMCDAVAETLSCVEPGYTQVYGLTIDSSNLHNGVPYSLDTSASIADGSFNRIAYQVELQKPGETSECVWVSMDAFTADASLIGVPSFAGSNTSFQQTLSNMNVISNKVGVVNGAGLSTGNIEFWPYNYGTANADSIPSASTSTFDTGDSNAGGSTYGSMQIHNHDANQTLFALNRFSGTSNKDLGIGNQIGGHPDWTFAGNVGEYTTKNINIYVTTVAQPVAEYRFDELSWNGSVNEVEDSSGNNNDAQADAASGLTTVDSGQVCRAGQFDGTNDYIESSSLFSYLRTTASLSFWIKTTQTGDDTAWLAPGVTGVEQSGGADDIFWGWIDAAGRIGISIANDYSSKSSIPINNGVYRHVVLTRDSPTGAYKIYIDGSLDSSGTIGIGDIGTSFSSIGRIEDTGGTPEYFQGDLDEVLVFDSVLSDAQVSSIYTEQLAENNFDGSTRTCATNTCATGTLFAVGIKIDSGGSNTQINSTTEALAIHAAWLAAGSPATGLIDNGTYNVAASDSSTVDRIDFGGSSRDFSPTLDYPGAADGVAGEDFLVHASGTISLPAGDYTIFVESDDGFSFSMVTKSGDTVIFDKFGASTAGANNELRFEGTTGNSNTGGSFSLSQDSVFDIAAIFFERGGGDYLEISIANATLTSGGSAGYEILSHGALGNKVQIGQCAVTSQIDHYEIVHDGQGLTCDAETVTIKACTDVSCSTLNTDTVVLDFFANGTVIDSPTFTGSTTVSFSHATVETLTLSVANASITESNTLECDDGSGNSCNIAFTDAGFRFLYGAGNSTTLPNQTSGSVFGDTLKLQAVENTDGVCTGIFTGNTNVNLSQENVDPGGTSGLSFSIDGNNLAKHTSVTTTVLNFGADSIATIPTPRYLDAGQIRIHANYDLAGVTLAGSSNSFWVAPAELVASATAGGIALNGASATATPIHKAGENFDLSVSAFNSLGAVTPNYLPGQIELKLTRTGPTLTSSVDGNLSFAASSVLATSISTSAAFQNATLTSFSAGVSTYNAAQYSEVGLLSLEAKDSNYGSASIAIAATPINIGRFIPNHFEQTVAQDGVFQATCGPRITFSAYSGQQDEATSSTGAISYLSNPILAITAYNKQGVITQNYYEDSEGSLNDFMKLISAGVGITAPTLDEVALGVDTNKLPLTANINAGTLSQNDLSALPSVVTLPRGVLHYQLSNNDNFFYLRSTNALVAPFTSDIDFSTASITDADNVNVTTTIDASPTGVEILFGRLRLENSFGPETSDFPQPMEVEHFDGADFIVSSNNNCTSYDASKISLTNISLDPALTNVLGGTGNFLVGKTKEIELEAPGAGNQGEIGVSYNAYNWLKYDWDNDGAYDDNPSATATFGVFRGHDRVIYWREVFN